MPVNPTIRLSTPADRDAILAFIARMGFNPRDAVTWDGLQMLAMSAWLGDRLVGAIPMEPRSLRSSSGRVIRALHETVVAVDPEYRATGIGSQLQQAIVEQRPTDAQLITVFREEPPSPAYRWYLKNGFTPLMEIQSWFCDEPETLVRPNAVRHWELADPSLPWADVESAWANGPYASVGGTIDRASRSLQEWLAVHPYRGRYAFHVVADDLGGYALLGVGTMHSQTLRGDLLEMMPANAELSAAESLIRATARVAKESSWRPLRLSLAKHDPLVARVASMGFVSRWSFDMLGRTIGDIGLKAEDPSSWRYAGIDYA